MRLLVSCIVVFRLLPGFLPIMEARHDENPDAFRTQFYPKLDPHFRVGVVRKTRYRFEKKTVSGLKVLHTRLCDPTTFIYNFYRIQKNGLIGDQVNLNKKKKKGFPVVKALNPIATLREKKSVMLRKNFRRFWAKEPRRSGTILDENCYLYIVARVQTQQEQ